MGWRLGFIFSHRIRLRWVALCEWNPSVIGNAERWCFRCCQPEDAVEQAGKLPVIWDVCKRPCDVTVIKWFDSFQHIEACTKWLSLDKMVDTLQKTFSSVFTLIQWLFFILYSEMFFANHANCQSMSSVVIQVIAWGLTCDKISLLKLFDINWRFYKHIWSNVLKP